MIESSVRLTQLSRSSGCGCKISPQELESILKNNTEAGNFKNLLVGNSTRDDAAVYDLGNGTALISTADFFTPVVDDPFLYGKIAAANALSDVYAMGGKPLMAISILGFPVNRLSADIASKIIEGAESTCADAGIPLAGGHSIDSTEPFFGLAVNGTVACSRVLKNSTAQPGDLLYLTKPLGTGIITSAAKKEAAKEEALAAAVKSMCMLNRMGEALGTIDGIHALTDVSGFGLLGHLAEMCEGSRVSAEINFEAIPVLCNLDYYLDKFIYPDMTTKIFASLSGRVSELSAKQLFILCDPQTSGGLLIAVSPGSVNDLINLAGNSGIDAGSFNPIGKITGKREKLISVF